MAPISVRPTFTDADLDDATFTGADISYAVFTGSSVTREQLATATGTPIGAPEA